MTNLLSRDMPCATLLCFANNDRSLLAGPFGIAHRGRSLSLGFYFIHSRHEQDFCERKAMNCVRRDLEHKRPQPDGQQGYCRLCASPSCT